MDYLVDCLFFVYTVRTEEARSAVSKCRERSLREPQDKPFASEQALRDARNAAPQAELDLINTNFLATHFRGDISARD